MIWQSYREFKGGNFFLRHSVYMFVCRFSLLQTAAAAQQSAATPHSVIYKQCTARLGVYMIYFPAHRVDVTNMSPVVVPPPLWRYIADTSIWDLAAPAKKTTDLSTVLCQYQGHRVIQCQSEHEFTFYNVYCSSSCIVLMVTLFLINLAGTCTVYKAVHMCFDNRHTRLWTQQFSQALSSRIQWPSILSVTQVTWPTWRRRPHAMQVTPTYFR